MEEEIRCARCGQEMTIYERVNNDFQVKVLGVNYMLHFCNICKDIIKEERE